MAGQRLRLPAEWMRVAAMSRRGLTLIELLMALAITGMVAAAISSMWSAISAGERSRRDNRDFMVRTHAARNRLSAYVVPGRCALFADNSALVLWLNDSRDSGTVHASELRWFIHNATTGDLDVYYVKFPAGYSERDKALRDLEYRLDTNWMAVLGTYTAAGDIASLTLVDGLESVNFSLDATSPLDAREVSLRLDFSTGSPGQVVSQTLTPTILSHATPDDPTS